MVRLTTLSRPLRGLHTSAYAAADARQITSDFLARLQGATGTAAGRSDASSSRHDAARGMLRTIGLKDLSVENEGRSEFKPNKVGGDECARREWRAGWCYKGRTGAREKVLLSASHLVCKLALCALERKIWRRSSSWVFFSCATIISPPFARLLLLSSGSIADISDRPAARIQGGEPVPRRRVAQEPPAATHGPVDQGCSPDRPVPHPPV
jgi:hypothetical protein